jgi:hypothetical protein
MSRDEPALGGADPSDRTAPEIDVSRPHAACIYDYYLGGKDHFDADRVTAEKALESWSAVRTGVRENRAFLGRAVRYLAEEAGIRQFLDIGTGLPSANNVHEVAQSVAPDARVVYVDNDPIVLTHAKALLTGAPQGRTAFIQADLREPERILANPTTREILEFDQPMALLLVAVLHFIPDNENPRTIVRTLVDALPSCSYMVASHVTPEHDPESVHGLEESYRTRRPGRGSRLRLTPGSLRPPPDRRRSQQLRRRRPQTVTPLPMSKSPHRMTGGDSAESQADRSSLSVTAISTQSPFWFQPTAG